MEANYGGYLGHYIDPFGIALFKENTSPSLFEEVAVKAITEENEGQLKKLLDQGLDRTKWFTYTFNLEQIPVGIIKTFLESGASIDLKNSRQYSWIKNLSENLEANKTSERVIRIFLEPAVNTVIALHLEPYLRGEIKDHNETLTSTRFVEKVLVEVGLKFNFNLSVILSEMGIRSYADRARAELQTHVFWTRLNEFYEEVVDEESTCLLNERQKIKALKEIALNLIGSQIHPTQQEAFESYNLEALETFIKRHLMVIHRKKLEAPLTLDNPKDKKIIELYLDALKDGLSHDFSDLSLTHDEIEVIGRESLELHAHKFKSKLLE